MTMVRFLRLATRAALLVGSALCITACSDGRSKLWPVTGTVLYQDQPARGAMVALHPLGSKNDATAQPSMGAVQEDGTFALSTGREVGAPEGEYIVTVVWYQAAGDSRKKGIMGGDDRPPVDRLKGAYADKAKSALTRHVAAGPNQLDPILLK
jgi:hypothetical protein